MPPQPLTDPYNFENQFARNFDIHGEEFRVCWKGDWRKPPDLSKFPRLEDATATAVPHGKEVKDIWGRSTAIAHGSEAHIRRLNSTDEFPICKVANNDWQRKLIRDEFLLLQQYGHTDPYIVRIHPVPLKDVNGIFGYRMEELSSIPHGDFAGHLDEIEKAIQSLHRTGIIHNDLSINNIMLNSQGRITLIDFGRAGHIDQHLPNEKERAVQPSGNRIYSPSLDYETLSQIRRMESLALAAL